MHGQSGVLKDQPSILAKRPLLMLQKHTLSSEPSALAFSVLAVFLGCLLFSIPMETHIPKEPIKSIWLASNIFGNYTTNQPECLTLFNSSSSCKHRRHNRQHYLSRSKQRRVGYMFKFVRKMQQSRLGRRVKETMHNQGASRTRGRDISLIRDEGNAPAVLSRIRSSQSSHTRAR